ncbi:hypothetical protein ScPMuIL_009638 [Solemya velum]
MGRKLRTRLDLLKPDLSETVRTSQEKMCSRNRSTQRSFDNGDPVVVRDYCRGDKWSCGTVQSRTGPVSYKIKVNDRLWRRHTDQLAKTGSPALSPPTNLLVGEEKEVSVEDTVRPDVTNGKDGTPTREPSTTVNAKTVDSRNSCGTPKSTQPTSDASRRYPCRTRPLDEELKYETSSKKAKTAENTKESTVSTKKPNSSEHTSLVSEKRNLSLEALFQVTDSAPSPSPLVIDEETTTASEDSGGHVIILEEDPSGSTLENVHIVTTEGVIKKVQLKSDALEEQGLKLVYTKHSYEQFDPNSISYGSYKPRNYKTSQQVVEKIFKSPEGETSSSSHGNVGRKRKHPQKPGRHICPYCGRGCAKPSVLQKHVRAHTGERPYPCVSCGFSFKTKSNLYKHCKSRAHALKLGMAPSSSKEDSEKVEDLEEESEDSASETESGEESEGDGSEQIGHKEQAPMHVLQEVARYLEKPKEERPKIEVPKTESKPEKLKGQEKNRPKFNRIQTFPVWNAPVRALLERKFSHPDDIRFQTLQNILPRIAPRNAYSSEHALDSPIVLPSSGNSTSLPSVVVSSNPVTSSIQADPQRKIKKSYIYQGMQGLKQIFKKSDKTSTLSVANQSHQENFTFGSDVSGLGETVLLPNTNSDPATATQALRQLEKLSKKFKQAANEGIRLSTLVKTLPNKTVQVTVQLEQPHSISEKNQIPTIKQPASEKAITPEMLKERIQQLISANAAIVDTPMADPPRPKRLSRQNSESGIGRYAMETVAATNKLDLLSETASGQFSIPNISCVPLQPMPNDSEIVVHCVDNGSENHEQKVITIVQDFSDELNIIHQKGITTSEKESITAKDIGITLQNDSNKSEKTKKCVDLNLPNISKSYKFNKQKQSKEKVVVQLVHPDGMPYQKLSGETVEGHTTKTLEDFGLPSIIISDDSCLESTENGSDLAPTPSVLPTKTLQDIITTVQNAKETPELCKVSQGTDNDQVSAKHKENSNGQQITIEIKIDKDGKAILASKTSDVEKNDQQDIDKDLQNHTHKTQEAVYLDRLDNLSNTELVILEIADREPHVTKDPSNENEDSIHKVDNEADNHVILDESEDSGHQSSGYAKENQVTIQLPTNILVQKQREDGTVISQGYQQIELNENEISQLLASSPLSTNNFQIGGDEGKSIHSSQNIHSGMEYAVLSSSISNQSKEDGNKGRNTQDAPFLKEKYSSEQTPVHEHDEDDEPNVSSKTDFTCLACNISFEKEQTLELHELYYCKKQESSEKNDEDHQTGIAIDKEIIAEMFCSSRHSARLDREQSTERRCVPIVLERKEPSSFVLENFEQRILPRKKGRPKGSKNRPKEIQLPIPQQQKHLIPVKLLGPFSTAMLPQTPSKSNSEEAHNVNSADAIVNSQTAGKLPVLVASLQSKPIIMPKLNIVQDTNLSAPMIGQPMVSIASSVSNLLSKDCKSLTAALPSTPISDAPSSLWKLKLKGKLLLKRSMSQEKEASSPSVSLPQSTQSPLVNAYQAHLEVPEAKKQKLINSPQTKSMRDTAPASEISFSSNSICGKTLTIHENPWKLESVNVPVAVAQPFYAFSQIRSSVYCQALMNFGLRQISQIVNADVKQISDFEKKSMTELLAKGSSCISRKSSQNGVLLSPSESDNRYSPSSTLKTISQTLEEKVSQTLEEKAMKNAVKLCIIGHSYPSLRGGTHTSFCCIRRPQPMYVRYGNNKKVSMYSNWKVASHNPNPFGMTPKMLLDLYNTRYTTNPVYADANVSTPKGGVLTHSSYWNFRQKLDPVVLSKKIVMEKHAQTACESVTANEQKDGAESQKEVKRTELCQGGFKSSEDYTYIRGRGRGKYVCETCGIRCKKPSMLKKHIRTHTDLRPYHCKHCRFSFKTKGNLTKHMKSKAHQRKCIDLGVVPVPIAIDESQIDYAALAAQCAVAKESRTGSDVARAMSVGSDTIDESDGEDEADESEDEGNQTLSKESPQSFEIQTEDGTVVAEIIQQGSSEARVFVRNTDRSPSPKSEAGQHAVIGILEFQEGGSSVTVSGLPVCMSDHVTDNTETYTRKQENSTVLSSQ